MIVSIIEKRILVDKSWKPDDSMIMHVATFDDWGAKQSTLEAAKEEMKQEGLKPVVRTLRIVMEFKE